MLSQYDGTPHAQKSLRLEVPLLLQKSSRLKTASDDNERSRKIQETKIKKIRSIEAQESQVFFFSERETGSRLMDQEVVLPPCPCLSSLIWLHTIQNQNEDAAVVPFQCSLWVDDALRLQINRPKTPKQNKYKVSPLKYG